MRFVPFFDSIRGLTVVNRTRRIVSNCGNIKRRRGNNLQLDDANEMHDLRLHRDFLASGHGSAAGVMVDQREAGVIPGRLHFVA